MSASSSRKVDKPYKCNRQVVISLDPLPHDGSTPMSENDASCELCGRKLTEPYSHSHCSTSGKVRLVSSKPIDSVPPFISVENPVEKQEETPEPSKRSKRRKGIPCRAPFF
ncbi:hypothetical protein L6164_023954 [Bauhinia variegata]|uniref:Uncharacterized protein n=1 Tax=Bauhinia variegata TaxID=167791 RepID=A0ACB9LX97_BAUVA|nr:hypothetical protein L6164_023954 [Bauhinia variegata]